MLGPQERREWTGNVNKPGLEHVPLEDILRDIITS